MSWQKVTVMSQKIEFIIHALHEGANISELCRRFNISRKTGYKFLNRYKRFGVTGLKERTRRPQNSPRKTTPEIEKRILTLRDDHPTWGGRKLKRRLEDMGHTNIPAPSTITNILKRNRRIVDKESLKHTPWKSFEAAEPNDLWQMDFKGNFPLQKGRCHPLTILDDHSRYSICIGACQSECFHDVKDQLTESFHTYGLPTAILVDNGSPWKHAEQFTKLSVWLIKLHIQLKHSSPFHPQTIGKDERFHRTLKAEIIPDCMYTSLSRCQRLFDEWRIVYNTERPHESLNMGVPSDRYRISNRRFNEKINEFDYGPTDQVRKVQARGLISFKNREFRVGRAFRGERVAVRPTNKDGLFKVYFMTQKIAEIDLNMYNNP